MEPATSFPFRQVHLDFHTSPQIPRVGARFSPEAFVETLRDARVNSVTLFARCHHGYIYYRSKRFGRLAHPHLERADLLREQVDACHAAGIRTPIYITVQWDHRTAEEHPEWLSRRPDGSAYSHNGTNVGFDHNLCVNTPYRDFLREQTADALEHVAADGVFFDIVQINGCSCDWCRGSMAERGIDTCDAEARLAFATGMINDFMREMTELVHSVRPHIPVFYNRGHVGPAHRPVAGAFGHFEIESLPSGGWGYLHFPVAARYARTLGLPLVGMTGKFHTSWGDFHSLKNRAALEFECFQMLALGSRCSVGDQLEPHGVLSPSTYDLIGSVYRRVADVEPWCSGATPVVEIGVLTPEEFRHTDKESIPQAILGATAMLQELGLQFDIVDSESELSRYRLLVMPDNIPATDSIERAVGTYLEAGGCVIAGFESGIDPRGEQFRVPWFGAVMRCCPTLAPDGRPARGRWYPTADFAEYLLPGGELADLPQTELTMYLKGVEIEAHDGVTVLAQTVAPFFHRAADHFCSHRQAPSSGRIDYPGVIQNGRVIYFAHPVFTIYRRYAPPWCKHLVNAAVERLMPNRLVEHDGPSTLLVTLNAQPAEHRTVAHLLHYIPQRRAEGFDVIEDVIPLTDVTLSLSARIKAARLVPDGGRLRLEHRSGRSHVIVPRVSGYAVVELSMENGQ